MASAIGHEARPCNRTQGTAPAIRRKVQPLQSDARYAPCNRSGDTTPTVGCKRRPYSRWQHAVPKRKCTPLDALLVACLGIPLPSLRREGLGVGLWAGGGSLGPPNAKRVPTARGLGNPRLLKGGGYLLSRIALQYHRRRRA